MFQGQSIRVTRLPGDIAELCFDRSGEPINKFDTRTVNELRDAAEAVRKDSGV